MVYILSCLCMYVQVNLDMTDSMGPGKLVRHMENPSYAYDEYLICIGLGPSILSVICKNRSYSGPSYPSSPVYILTVIPITKINISRREKLNINCYKYMFMEQNRHMIRMQL